MTAYIITTGTPSPRCVVYGYADAEPAPGEPVRLERARMVLSWKGGGLFRLAASGPVSGDRLTHAVGFTSSTAVGQVLAVSDAAAAAIDAWAAA